MAPFLKRITGYPPPSNASDSSYARGSPLLTCTLCASLQGGVLSGIGKGVTASTIGVLCKMMGLRPTAIKIDPYLNVDAGTMSPFEHGEVSHHPIIDD